MYLAYEIPERFRNNLIKLVPPSFHELIGHHVTIVFGVDADCEIPDDAEIKIEKHIKGFVNGAGIECLTVSVNGQKRRPDGGCFHLTWSIDREKGAKPFHSNELIMESTNIPSLIQQTRATGFSCVCNAKVYK